MPGSIDAVDSELASSRIGVRGHVQQTFQKLSRLPNKKAVVDEAGYGAGRIDLSGSSGSDDGASRERVTDKRTGFGHDEIRLQRLNATVRKIRTWASRCRTSDRTCSMKSNLGSCLLSAEIKSRAVRCGSKTRLTACACVIPTDRSRPCWRLRSGVRIRLARCGAAGAIRRFGTQSWMAPS